MFQLVRLRALSSLVHVKSAVKLKMSSFSTDLSNTSTNLKLALCQLKVGSDKEENIRRAKDKLQQAKVNGAELIVLPECWNSPYSTASFPQYAEIVPNVNGIPDKSASPSVFMLCEQAKALGVWIIGGSVPERDNSTPESRLYNTCIVANPLGEIVGKHRKVHLFDIDVPGRIRFKESDSLSPGLTPTLVDTPWGTIGIGICYDVRFPELAILMRKRGCKILVYPGAFNMVTGPAHWELLFRARAVDNQLFVASCSPARDEGAGYIAWGHSLVVNPWGEVIASAAEGEETVLAELDMTKVESVRDSIPCWKQKRFDVYTEIESPTITTNDNISRL
eukprot:gene5169-10338_t